MATTMIRELTRIKVQITADQPGDPASLWTAFASSEGVAIPVFAGRSWKSEANACKAARKWLNVQDAKHVPNRANVSRWVPSAQDDVIAH
jgi:hypothetical protein